MTRWLSLLLLLAASADAAEPVAVGPVPGPVQEAVAAIEQDSVGFLWIGTRQGLYLYDGQEYRIFVHDPADPTSISDNDVRTIYEDPDGNLWIGTNTGGLNRLDRASWTFEHYRHDPADPTSISHDSVYGMRVDRNGRLWVGTQIGLNRLNPATGGFVRFIADPADPATISNDYVYAIHRDSGGDLWIGTVGGGLNRLDPVTGELVHFRHDPADPDSLSDDDVFALAEDADGNLWIGTDTGLNRLNPESGAFELRAGGTDPGAPVTSIGIGVEGTVWFGTFGQGLGELNPTTGAVRYHPVEAGDGRVIDLEIDRAGAVWIGTWSSGLRRLHAERSPFEITGPANSIASGYEEATVVLEDRSGRLWVGTWGRGLGRRDPGESSFRRYWASDGPQDPITVLSIAEGLGAVWFGTMDGLWRLDPETDEMRLYAQDPEPADSLGNGYVTAILNDSDGRIWAGVGGSGLHRLREDGERFDRFLHDQDDPATLSEDYVTALSEDRRGLLWVGTRSGGLNALDRGTGACRRYLPDADDPTSISHHHVTSMLEDEAGVLWVGTGGGGLNRVERRADGAVSFTRITERDGLVDNNVMGIAQDTDGSLWLGTKRGLSRFHPETREFVNFKIGTLLPAPVFQPGGVTAGRRVLYFGTRKGVVVVPLGTPFPERKPFPVVMTAIATPGGPIVGDRPVWNLDRIEVPYGEVLSFKFVVLDFGAGHRYAYRLDITGDRWVDLGERREITFTDLEPGEHELSIRGRNDQGVWSEAATPLRIRIVPPFWMTTWFRGGSAMLLVMAALAAYWIRTSTLERRNRELLRLKNQREQALAEARASEEKLARTYDDLRQLTRRLEAAKEDERKRIARELHDEMGQALSAAKINLQRLARRASDETGTRYVEDAIRLINDMIEHVRALSLDLRPPLLDELGLVPALKGYAEGVAHRTGLRIEIDARDGLSGLPPDETVAAFRIVQEALTNVVRHAQARSVAIGVHGTPDSLRLSIRDDGVGFDLDQALVRAAAGHHLGLLGMRERVEVLGGSLNIVTSSGQGTEIRVTLPRTLPVPRA